MTAIESFLADVRHALRGFRKNPGFTLTALTALTLGIGATTGIFSAVNIILFKPLHIPDADRFVVLATLYAADGYRNADVSTSPPQFAHWRMPSDVLQDVSAFFSGRKTYTGGAAAEEWTSMTFSAGAFRCFGIRVLKGRTFTEEEDRMNGPHVAVLGKRFWENRFGRDPEILGKQILLDGESYTVIGIVEDSEAIRRDFDVGAFPNVYVPFQAFLDGRDHGNRWFITVARLKPGVTLHQAQDRLKASSDDYRARFPEALGPKDFFSVKLLRELYLSSDMKSGIAILFTASGLVLLIACANVANLQLARASAREREIAIRCSIGAGRRRVIRQLMTESLLLALAGGAAGTVLGARGMSAFLALSEDLPPQVDIDWRVMVFAVAVSLAAAALFGFIPSLQASRADLNSVLKNGGAHSAGIRRNKTRAALVVCEAGLAVILLIGSSLLIRDFVWLVWADRGFDTANVSTVRTMFNAPRYREPGVLAEAAESALERIRSLPGVSAAAATSCIPLECGRVLTFDIMGRRASEPAGLPSARWTSISPGFFETLHVPLKRGRVFSSRDNHGASPVVVINEAMAKKYWKDRDPLLDGIIIAKGTGMDYLNEPVRQIVGIVGDMRVNPADPDPIMYVPMAQVSGVMGYSQSRLTWVIRTESELHGFAPAIRDELKRATGLPPGEVRTMHQLVKRSINDQQMLMTLMSIFGSAALLLAAVGIYGVMAYTVEQRTQEIGIRIALGADPARVKFAVVRKGASIAAVGVGVGWIAAWGLVRSLESFLVGVKARDPLVFVAAPVILWAVAILAAWIPATRASRVNPMESLRCD